MEGPPQSQPAVSEQVAWTLYILYWLFYSLPIVHFLFAMFMFFWLCFFSLCVFLSVHYYLFSLLHNVFVCQQTLASDSAWEDLLVLHLEYLFCLCLVASWFPLCFTCLSTISPLTHCRLLMFRIHMLVHCIFREINRCLNFSINECYELNKDYQNKTSEWFVSALQMAL